MKLVITGTMGIAFASVSYAMLFRGNNARGARVFLDFTNCDVPEITALVKDFIAIGHDSIILHISGLVVKTTRYGAWCAAGQVFFDQCYLYGGVYAVYCSTNGASTFTNCKLSGGDSGAACQMTGTSTFINCSMEGTQKGVNCENTFAGTLHISTNSKVIGGNAGVYSNTANTNAVIKLSDSVIAGGVQDLKQDSTINTMHWLIKGCSFSKAFFTVNSVNVYANTTVANLYLAVQAYHNLFSQTVN